MLSDWLKRLENPGKLALEFGVAAIVLFLLWAALIVACVVGTLVAIFAFDQNPVAAILGGIVAYFVVMWAVEFWTDISPMFSRSRREEPPRTVEEPARRR
jgi:nicotinamide riboside transporter PnuC